MLNIECASSALDHSPRVTVLLALYNGVAHLEPQLRSYLCQTLPPSRVLASDDRPGDGTCALFHHIVGQISQRLSAPGSSVPEPVQIWDVIEGPQQGLTHNFLHLLNAVDPDETDYVALSDQDDIWLPNKLESATRIIAACEKEDDHPILLGTRSWEWDAEQDRRVLSRSIPGPLNFSHALMQNFAGGNTMVLNRAALRLVQQALIALQTSCPAVHDWWLYQLISGSGGTVLLDPEPRLLYRQHSQNQIGANATLQSKLQRFNQMLKGTYRDWMEQNLRTLQICAPLLTEDSRALLSRLEQERHGPLPMRLRLMLETPLHRKGCVNQAALWLAAALGKI